MNDTTPATPDGAPSPETPPQAETPPRAETSPQTETPPRTDTPPQTPPATAMSERDARQWAMLCHLSALSGLLGIGACVEPRRSEILRAVERQLPVSSQVP